MPADLLRCCLLHFLLLALPAVLLVSGCVRGDDERQAIQAVMMQRQQALRSKDIDSYLSLISPHYLDKGQDLAAKKQELAANFASFDRIEYRSDGYDIVIDGSGAIVSGSYRLKIARKSQVLELEGKESIRLRKEPGRGWLIVGGL
ncbi:nuclear transport factor 2 family protein [Geotalea sp. SG265]|uniref:YybH family protein n=1 Tax=Geotalea sp. SG265 TaxID=2922867 RepID=UPI001FAFD90A|nr:nuclear transport factor 2 family protein [Geotalea sp. SG265]